MATWPQPSYTQHFQEWFLSNKNSENIHYTDYRKVKDTQTIGKSRNCTSKEYYTRNFLLQFHWYKRIIKWSN